VNKTLRITGIVVCGGLLLAPQVVCYLNASPGLLKWMNLVRLLFPLTFYVLANLLIDEGRARERADQESRRMAR
jgi:hypothetical protein